MSGDASSYYERVSSRPYTDPTRKRAKRSALGMAGLHKGEGAEEVRPKPARNAPCPCGSGKKAKRCCP